MISRDIRTSRYGAHICNITYPLPSEAFPHFLQCLQCCSFLSKRAAWNLKGVNQGLIQQQWFCFVLSSFSGCPWHFHFAFTEPSIITSRSCSRMLDVISETTAVYADPGLSFPTCITSQSYTMNFSCCTIAQPLSLVRLFCNSPQPAHVPVLPHNLVSSTVFTSGLVPFSNDVCVH